MITHPLSGRPALSPKVSGYLCGTLPAVPDTTVVTVSALLAVQVFLVIAILMGEGLYMVVKVLYSSKQKHDYTS